MDAPEAPAPDFCLNCGEPLPEGTASCARCGRKAFQQKFLGELLIDEGLVSREKLEEALRLQKRKLGEVLVDIGACQSGDIDRVIRLQRRGRTRAQRYVRYFKIASALLVASIAALVACLAYVFTSAYTH